MGYEDMLSAVLNGRDHIVLVNDTDRGIGKSYSLKELGLELQALGYKVFVASYSREMEYYAEKFVDVGNIEWSLRGQLRPVLMVDDLKADELDALTLECWSRRIPVVGYANII